MESRRECRFPGGEASTPAGDEVCYAEAMNATDESRVTWVTHGEALRMFLRGDTVPSASRIALVVGTWLTLMNHGNRLFAGDVPWITIALDYATPFMVSSLGFLAARRHSNVERLIRLLDQRDPNTP
jgi:hypothetical protein